MKLNMNAHWRDSARPIKFFIWDGRAVFPVLILILHIALWTFILTVVLISFFTLLNRFGFTPSVFGRWIRSTIAGPRKSAVPWWME